MLLLYILLWQNACQTKWRESSLCNGSKDTGPGISLRFQNLRHVSEPARYVESYIYVI